MDANERSAMIGRAAWYAFYPDKHSQDFVSFDDNTAASQAEIIASALAAVAEARRIDKCHSCERARNAKGDPDCRILIFMAEIHNTSVVSMSHDFGCNRHEPKEGE